MNLEKYLLLILILTISIASNAQHRAINYVNVVMLDSDSYNKTINQNNYVFVEYYIPNCKHCVRFAAQYQLLATELKRTNAQVVVAAVNIKDSQQIAQLLDLQSFPTFKFYIFGYELSYEQERSYRAMLNFIISIMTAKIQVASSKQDLIEPYVAISGVFIDNKSPLNILPILFEKYPIYYLGPQNKFSVQIYNDQEVKRYSGPAELSEILQWLDFQSSPILVSLGESVVSSKLKRVMAKKIPILAIFNKNEHESVEHTLEFLTSYCKDATAFVCGYAHKDEEDYQSLMEWIGDKDQTKNILVWIDLKRMVKYMYPGDINQITFEELDKFIESIKRGSATVYRYKRQNTSQSSKEEEKIQRNYNVEQL